MDFEHLVVVFEDIAHPRGIGGCGGGHNNNKTEYQPVQVYVKQYIILDYKLSISRNTGGELTQRV